MAFSETFLNILSAFVIAGLFYVLARFFLVLGKRYLYETWFHDTFLRWTYRIMALLTILSLIGTGLLSQSSLLSLTQNEIYALTLTFLFLTYAILMLSLPQSWVREIQPSFTITRKETALPDRLMKRIKTVFQMERFQEKERKKKKMLTVMSIVVLILLLSVL